MTSSSPPTSAPLRWFPVTRALLAVFRQELFQALRLVGTVTLSTTQALKYLFQGRLTWGSLLEQCRFVGVDSLPIALTLTGFSGMVIALQVAVEMANQGASLFVGALVAMALVRELGPLMSGFAVIALAGSAYAAELSVMKGNNQLDALQVLHVDPLRYLFLPRMLACVFMLPLLTLITSVVGIVAGMGVSATVADIPYSMFLDSVWEFVDFYDLFGAFIKTALFGFFIATLSCTIGLVCDGGAKNVGQSTTKAVVWSFVTMTLVDFVMTYLLYGIGG